MRLFDQAIEVREQRQKPLTEPSLKSAKPRPKISEEGSLQSDVKERTIVPTLRHGNTVRDAPASRTAGAVYRRSRAGALVFIHKYSQDTVIPPSAGGIRVGRSVRAFYSSHAPAWEFSSQRSSVAGRWSVYHCIPTPERGNDANGDVPQHIGIKPSAEAWERYCFIRSDYRNSAHSDTGKRPSRSYNAFGFSSRECRSCPF
jgi:hypothetical protein